MFVRRLWAYESWIILSFYMIFVYLTLVEEDLKEEKKWIASEVERFREILSVNLILLIFPWGLFLIIAPSFLLEIMGLHSFYWRVLGGASLLGALIYLYPLRFYRKKLSFYIFLFGVVDNFLAGVVLTILFILGRVPLSAWASVPLLFYFSFFFFQGMRKYSKMKI